MQEIQSFDDSDSMRLFPKNSVTKEAIHTILSFQSEDAETTTQSITRSCRTRGHFAHLLYT